MKKLIQKAQSGTAVKKRLDSQALSNDPSYKKWYIDHDAISQLQDSLIARDVPLAQRIAFLSQIIPESGGRTKPHGNGALGLVGWRGNRKNNVPSDLPGQIHHLLSGVYDDPLGKEWHHGGAGSGAQTGKEMQAKFKNELNTANATTQLMRGFVRPESKQHAVRLEFADLLKKYMR